jgi:hypothetical protein
MGSPESRVIAGIGRRALPLIDTDDTDQQKEQGNGRRGGRRCHMRVAGTAIRKIEGVARS